MQRRITASCGQEAFLDGHEKGGVEGQVGYWRRNYLTPVPRLDSLDELNDAFAASEQAEENRRIGMRIRTIGQDVAQAAPLLLPLPGDAFETGLAFTPRVDRNGMVAVRVFGPGPLHRPHRSRPALLERGRRLPPSHRDRPPLAPDHEGRRAGGAGALPGGPAGQAGSPGRLRGTRPGPPRGHLHPPAHEAF
nr:hypothetical protein [Streptomyces sp. CBMA123]